MDNCYFCNKKINTKFRFTTIYLKDDTTKVCHWACIKTKPSDLNKNDIIGIYRATTTIDWNNLGRYQQRSAKSNLTSLIGYCPSFSLIKNDEKT